MKLSEHQTRTPQKPELKLHRANVHEMLERCEQLFLTSKFTIQLMIYTTIYRNIFFEYTMAGNKRSLYVGGLAEGVDVSILKSAFSPFGDINDVNIPLDYSTQKHKGFAFIEYRSPEDAADAIDNMDNAELLGKTIRVNIAKPTRYKDSHNKPIWDDDEYLRNIDNEQEVKTDTQGDVELPGSSDED